MNAIKLTIPYIGIAVMLAVCAVGVGLRVQPTHILQWCALFVPTLCSLYVGCIRYVDYKRILNHIGFGMATCANLTTALDTLKFAARRAWSPVGLAGRVFMNARTPALRRVLKYAFMEGYNITESEAKRRIDAVKNPVDSWSMRQYLWPAL